MSTKKLKIEVFKFILNPSDKVEDPSFLDLFRQKFGIKEEEKDENKIFEKYLKKFIKTIDDTKYCKVNKNAEKAFAFDSTPEYTKNSYYISGVLKGGIIINNKHFFLLYTPLNSATGYLIFQGYSQENIRKDFCTYIERNIFRINRIYQKTDFKPYLPDEIKDYYKDGATVSQITYSEEILSSNISSDKGFINGPSNYRVKVIVEPIGDDKDIDINYLNRNDKVIEKAKLFGKFLANFSKKSGILKQGKKKTPFKFNDLDDIYPSIYLEEEYFDENGLPNFTSVEKYCSDLLEKIKDERNAKIQVQPVE